jgi:hypothetical protein
LLRRASPTDSRARFWIEAAFSGLCVTLLGLTLLVPDWIEAVFGVDPDRHSGFFEWTIVGLLAAAGAASGALARLEWRPRLDARASTSSAR